MRTPPLRRHKSSSHETCCVWSWECQLLLQSDPLAASSRWTHEPSWILASWLDSSAMELDDTPTLLPMLTGVFLPSSLSTHPSHAIATISDPQSAHCCHPHPFVLLLPSAPHPRTVLYHRLSKPSTLLVSRYKKFSSFSSSSSGQIDLWCFWSFWYGRTKTKSLIRFSSFLFWVPMLIWAEHALPPHIPCGLFAAWVPTNHASISLWNADRPTCSNGAHKSVRCTLHIAAPWKELHGCCCRFQTWW